MISFVESWAQVPRISASILVTKVTEVGFDVARELWVDAESAAGSWISANEIYSGEVFVGRHETLRRCRLSYGAAPKTTKLSNRLNYCAELDLRSTTAYRVLRGRVTYTRPAASRVRLWSLPPREGDFRQVRRLRCDHCRLAGGQASSATDRPSIALFYVADI